MKRRLAVLMFVLAISSACVDQSPVGAIDCAPRHLHCGVPNVRETVLTSDELPMHEHASAGLRVVTPSWSRKLPELDDQFFDTRLMMDQDRELAVIRRTSQRVEIRRLDDQGEIVASLELEAPGGLPNGRPITLDLVTTPLEFGPLIEIDWIRSCDEPSEECKRVSEIVELNQLEETRRREAAWKPESSQVIANESGVWLIDGPARIEHYDFEGDLQWRHMGLLERAPSWTLSGVVQGRSRLRVLVGTYDAPADVWTFNGRGELESLLSIQISWREAPRLVADARGRLIVIGTVASHLGGDLWVLRIEDEREVERGIVLQEEFQPLRASHVAIDAEGGVYVASVAGGREREDQRSILCRLDDAPTLACFTLATDPATTFYIADMAVSQPDVVYVVSADTLMRFDLPDSDSIAF